MAMFRFQSQLPFRPAVALSETQFPLLYSGGNAPCWDGVQSRRKAKLGVCDLVFSCSVCRALS